MYSSFLKPYNPRRSQSDVSIESQSSNESGYGGSSPVFSRQNSNSTLTFNQETAAVSFSTAPPPNHSHARTSQDVGPSWRNPSPSCQPPNQRDSDSSHSSHRGSANHRELPGDTGYRNTANHRDYSSDSSSSYRIQTGHRDSLDSTPTNHREFSDSSETDSCSSSRNSSWLDSTQRYGQSRAAFSSHQRRNRDGGAAPKRSQHPPEEYSEPEVEADPEVDGHQVRQKQSIMFFMMPG